MKMDFTNRYGITGKAVLFFMLLLSADVPAQEQAKLYDEMCEPLQMVFCDYVRNESSQNYIKIQSGSYNGTIIDDKIYGWGYIKTNDGASSFGQFRNGSCIFGISMSGKTAKVGGNVNYVLYDLETGKISALHTREGNLPLKYPLADSNDKASPYSFKREKYANGDEYIGEFYNGRRHGYGIYYWTNGEIWYGKYEGGYRNGYGMLVKPNHKIFYGKWVGDTKVDE